MRKQIKRLIHKYIFKKRRKPIKIDQDMHEVVRKHCMDYLVSLLLSALTTLLFLQRLLLVCVHNRLLPPR